MENRGANDGLVKREPWKFILWMGATMGLYSFYVVPQFAKAVNRLRRRDKYTPWVVFWAGLATLGLGLAVFEILFAFDLEKNPVYTQGKWTNRRLSALVLILNAMTWILAFVPRGDAFIGSLVFGVSATLLIQHKINQYVDMNLDALET